MVMMVILGLVLIVIGVVGWVVTYLTNMFTFNYASPIFSDFKTKRYVINIFVPLAIEAGVAVIGGAFVGPLFKKAGFPSGSASFIAFFGIFICMQLVASWFDPWGPIMPRLLRARLAAQGVPPERVAAGMPAGISDPSVKSSKKMSLIEDDVGLLWLEPEALTYLGDTMTLRIEPADVIEIERVVDNGSVAALFGAVNPIIRYRTPGGERRVRLHVEYCWNYSGEARALDDLAERLERWHRGAELPTLELA
jgi:hypothetical protein